MKLYSYQKEYIKSAARFDIINKSRQIGWSSGSIAYKSIKRVLNGVDQLLVSSSQRQSNKLMSFCERYIERVLIPMGVKLKEDTKTIKTFYNGKSIHCLPSKPETIRSFSGDVRIDEYALHKEDEKIFEALLPSITKKKHYQISICSTPLGKLNMFYSIYNDINKYPDFIRKEINYEYAIKQGCEMDIETIKRNFDSDSFEQEFNCQFLDSGTSYFGLELLKNCVQDYEPETIKGTNHFGIDTGRTNDLFAKAIVTKTGEDFYLKNLEVLKNKSFEILSESIQDTFNSYPINKTFIDKGGIGYQLAEESEKKYRNTYGVFTNNSKFILDAMTYVKKLMEQKRFIFYDEPDIIRDFHKIKKVYTINNNISFQIPRDKSGHGDRAIAIILALFSFKQDSMPDIM